MDLISAPSILRALAIFHVTAAFFMLTAPEKIADQNIVFILGEAMKLPHVSAFNRRTPATAFSALLLALLGFSDITTLSMREEVAGEVFAALLPVRLLFFFGVTGFTYTFRQQARSTAIPRNVGGDKSFGSELKNSFVFTWAFMETVVQFWAFYSLRNERRQKAVAMLRKRAEQEQ